MSERQFRFIERKECNVLTWKAKGIILLGMVCVFAVIFLKLPLFLSKSAPVQGDVLVLDGHMPDYAIQKAIQVFDSGSYQRVIVTGGNLPSGYYISGMKTMAELSYATFLELGFDSTKIVAIPGGEVLRNRTYNSALSLRHWLEEENIKSIKIDVFCVGCHARRSEYLFKKALGENYDVGVVSVDDESYDIRNWWKSSKGTRTVVSETIGYFYSICFLFTEPN
jgi:uncharacterized SAM-binding protein YcdF (DUF218 family)